MKESLSTLIAEYREAITEYNSQLEEGSFLRAHFSFDGFVLWLDTGDVILIEEA